MTETETIETRLQDRCREFCDREILCHDTLLISAIMADEALPGFSFDDVENLYEEYPGEDQVDEIIDGEGTPAEIVEKLKELADRVDLESYVEIEWPAEPEEEEGQSSDDRVEALEEWVQQSAEALVTALEQVKGESEPKEIFEWYRITNWMADLLRDRNEAILANDYGTWWGRAATGQAVYMDGVIRDIVENR